MFKIKRKLIISLCLSLAMLSGCGENDSKPVHIFSAEAPSDASQTSDTPKTGTSSSSAVASAESLSEPSVNDTQTIIYNHDPQNSCTITFDGDSITVTGAYGDLFNTVVAAYPKMNIEKSVDNDILTVVMTPETTDYDRRFGSFFICDRSGHPNAVFIDLSDGSLKCPDTSGLVKSNNAVSSSVVEASVSKVAQYITMDGSLERIPQILDEVKRLSDDICKDIVSDYEKLRAISRWVSDNIYYDHPIYNIGAPQHCLSLEYTLNNRSGICGSYSNLTAALCAAQDIRCLNITGMALTDGQCYLQNAVGAYHEWNVAEIGGRQVIVDPGWNSGLSISNDGSRNDKKPCYAFFDISEEVFSFDHKAQTAEYRDFYNLFQY